jgi:beta-galactosidase
MHPPITIRLFLNGIACVLFATAFDAAGNSDMYPPTPAAKPFIDVDGHGFIVNGKRVYIESGSIHYPRVPPELWRDRLLRLRRASFNTVQTYAFWNFSEPRENEWHLTGSGDIGAFLSTAQSVGLYATVRPGPYVCAEWDFGGFPLWLKFIPGIVVRTDDAPYLAVNDHWYDKILPIVAAHQINRGGNVIMVQLENEHGGDWGVVHNPYFDHLEAKAEELGIEVPHFMSGMHHGPQPTPERPVDPQARFPWYSTESWNGWFDTYGDVSSGKLRGVEAAQWNTMAKGGAGQNFYMAHGGTDFDTWNYAGVAASYDYGAPIGQTGDLRPIYYRMKRANQLAESFPEILAGVDATADYRDFVTGAEVAGARRGSTGTIIFLRNPTGHEMVAHFKDGTAITMRKSETFPIVQDAVIAPGVKIADTTLRVLSLAHNGGMTTVVVYGVAGDAGRLTLASGNALKAISPMARASVSESGGNVVLNIKIPTTGPDEYLLGDSVQQIRVVAMSTDLAWYTWVVGEQGKQSVVVGPEYVSDFADSKGQPAMLVERPYGAAAPGQVVVYGAGPAAHLAAIGNPAMDAAPAPVLGAWQMSAAPEAAPGYDDSKWKTTEDPEQMGTDGDNSAFAWYRASIDMPAAGTAVIGLVGGDDVAVFVNGAAAEMTHDRTDWIAQANFSRGRNSIAVFTSHGGRPDLYNYFGPLTNLARKGLFGAVTITASGVTTPVKNWKMHGGVDPAAFKAWSAVATTKGAPALYRTTFRAAPPAATGAHPIYRATFSGLTRGTMWLNGHNLGRYPEKIRVNGLYLPECWLGAAGNTLEVFDETGAAPAAVKIETETATSREVIRVDKPCDAATPIIVPVEDTTDQIAKTNAGNVAYNRTATASSSESGNGPENATDGDADTRWCASGPQMPQWLSVDLGAPQKLGSCEIVWENRALGYTYTVEGSADGATWQKLGDDKTAVPQSPDSPALLSRIPFPATNVRYLRVTVTSAANGKWASICELRGFKPE